MQLQSSLSPDDWLRTDPTFTHTATTATRPPFQGPVDPNSSLIASGWVEQLRRSKLSKTWKNVVLSLVKARRPGEETTLWVQREIVEAGGFNGTRLEPLQSIPIKWLRSVELITDYPGDNRFSLRAFNIEDAEFVFRSHDPDATRNWVMTLRTVIDFVQHVGRHGNSNASSHAAPENVVPKDLLQFNDEKPRAPPARSHSLDMNLPLRHQNGSWQPQQQQPPAVTHNNVQPPQQNFHVQRSVPPPVPPAGQQLPWPSNARYQSPVPNTRQNGTLPHQQPYQWPAQQQQQQPQKVHSMPPPQPPVAQQQQQHPGVAPYQFGQPQPYPAAPQRVPPPASHTNVSSRQQRATPAPAATCQQHAPPTRGVYPTTTRPLPAQRPPLQTATSPIPPYYAARSPPPQQTSSSPPPPNFAKQHPSPQGSSGRAHAAATATPAIVTSAVGHEKQSWIKQQVVMEWALQPPQLQQLRPVDELLLTIQNVFPPKFGLRPHEYFTKGWTVVSRHGDLLCPLGQQIEAAGKRAVLDNDKLQKCIRKLRFFLHPDKLPRDLDADQAFLCRLLWDITQEAWEEYKKRNEQPSGAL